ncbi:hypothetical protein [Geodermatophilus obscurus]|uniref:ABC-2 type transport system permease protein n=1 Tax=Geodermatophilus obscurus (strain ATCC 25078 / DSM 43160 / JCM 3152 / CCUG 61914 / KCC A-0152 / KCTC 9177 / NBRC 13315 / NRRL B-3577 / G-20) TaxID=526225 RepID=D2S9R1_GEOOG|nr:hypothetical protein [Geodermatophilus obscurus]ADB73774.1 conserved hypothetical protein [Geodermatophilus obscurus DSM 43160]
MSTLTPDRTAASGHLALLADRTPWRTVLGLALALTAALALLLSAFAWPATQTRPRDVPVAVVGPPPAVEQVRTALGSAQPGAFDVTAAVDAAQARQLVRDREVSGALVLGPGGPSVVVATQAGPAVAQLLTQVAQGATGATVPVEDVAPPPADDPRGAGLAAGALPLSITGAVAGAVLALRVRGPGRRAAGAVVLALLAGPTAVGVLHGWLGALGGDWLAESAVVSLGIAAITLGVLGIAAVAGRAGLVLAELTVVALGNPLSAAAGAPALLPDGWRELGQALPPGAVVAALRSVAGFDGTGAAGPLTVLVLWVTGGLLLLAVAGVRARRHGTYTAA